MTTVPIFHVGLPPDARSGAPSFTTTQMEMASATDVLEFLIQAPATGSITQIGFLTGLVTTGCTLDVRVETINLATGRGSGTLVNAGANGSQVIGNADDNVWFSTTLGTAASVTKGQYLSIKFAVSSGTPSALRIVGFQDNTLLGSYPGCLEDDGTPALAAAAPVVALNYGGTWMTGPGCFAMSAVNSRVINTGTNPDAIGLRFKMACSVRLCAMWFWGDVDGDVEIELLSDNGATSLTALTWDKDLPYGDTGEGLHYVILPGSPELTADTWYRLVFRAREGTSMTLYTMSAASTAIMAAMPLGANAYFCGSDYSAPNYGTFTDTTTEVPFLGLSFDGVATGSAATASFAPVGGGFIRGLGVV